MGQKVLVSVLFAGLLALAGAANAAVYTAPTLEAYGSKVLTTNDLSVYGGSWQTPYTYTSNNPSGSSWTINVGTTGAEVATYYAFKVPTGSAVAITGGKWSGVAGGVWDGWSGSWAETMLWSCNNLDGSVVGATAMNKGNVASFANQTASGRWGSNGAYAQGYDYFSYDTGSVAANQFDAVFNYAANVQHFQEAGGPGTNPTSPTAPKNPLDATYRGGNDSGWTQDNVPATATDISASNYVGTGLNRLFQDSDLPSGNPMWMVTAGSEAETEVCVLAKIGGTNGTAFTVSDLTFEIRGPGDANGDKKCDATDLNTVLSFYNQAGGWDHGDFNGDGFVDATDLNTVLSYYNRSYGAGNLNSSVVPEPSTICLALSSLAMLLVYWLRKR